MTVLHRALSQSVGGTGSWRRKEEYFNPKEVIGAVEMSPAWFQLGHQVRPTVVPIEHLIDACKGGEHAPEVSALLKESNPDKGPRRWLEDQWMPITVMSASMMVMHPDLYASGREALGRLQAWAKEADPEMAALIPHWPSVFSVISVIKNRETPLHRDQSCRVQWLDLLVGIGEDPDLHMELESIGRRVRYRSGTVIALSGKLIRHGVPESTRDRTCIVQHMRDAVHAFAKVHRAEHPSVGSLRELLEKYSSHMSSTQV